jgi:hypothetical protein
MPLLVHGSGFQSPFSNPMMEIRCGKATEIGGDPACNWNPSNPDFETLARTSGGGTGVANLKELADFIERQPVGSIDELRILGHSSSAFFALAGTIVTNDPNILVRFEEKAMMGESATFLGLQPRFHKLRDRFQEKGKITLAGCGSGGTDSKLLDLVSRSFLVCVAGFKRPIQYALNIQFPQTPATRNARQRIGPSWFIANRGRVSYSSATLKIEEVLGDSFVDTTAFGTDAWKLASDAESCAGQLIVDAIKRTNAAKGLGQLGSATEVGWRILREFFSDKLHLFSGVKGDDTLRGLRFEPGGKGGMLVVGRAYALATSPQTIDQRVAEMEELIKYAQARQAGTVMMK